MAAHAGRLAAAPSSPTEVCRCPSVQHHPGAQKDHRLTVSRWVLDGICWISLTGQLDLVSVDGALRLLCEHCPCDIAVINVSGLAEADDRAVLVLRRAWASLAGRGLRTEVIDPAHLLDRCG